MRLFSICALGVFCCVFTGTTADLESAQVTTNSLRPWREYQVIMWTGDSAYRRPDKLPLFFQRLREMGVTAGMVHNDADPTPLVTNGFPFYAENLINRGLCLKFHSKVTEWDQFITEWAKSGRSETGLHRDYCLDDPQWQRYARTEMQRLVKRYAPFEPLAYDIRDELSVTISANPFDYDFNPLALAGFRSWLKTQYPDLSTLNQQWETRFGAWDEVKPFTTDQIKSRMGTGEPVPAGKPDWGRVAGLRLHLPEARNNPTRWNFSPWADFRTYMDLSLARELNALRLAAHQIDPRTPVGIEGTQMPHSFGGYDLWRLSQVLDWVEPYDIANAREIFGSFMRGKPILTTVFEKDTKNAQRRLWHLLLEGDKGCIIWWSEDCLDWKSPDYALTDKAKALQPVLKELSSPVAKLFLRAEPIRDPIYLHYSQPSIQVNWLLESTVDGPTWLRRFSSFEAQHNLQARIRASWLKAFQDLGFSPQFVSTEQIEAGFLRDQTCTLVLPASWALTDLESREIGALLREAPAKGAELYFDRTPGVFDGHGKLRAQSVLNHLWDSHAFTNGTVAIAAGKTNVYFRDIAPYATERARSRDLPFFTTRLRPEIEVPAELRIRVHRFRSGDARLVAFERNIAYHMSEELKQAGGNEGLEMPVEFEARLPSDMHVYELTRSEYLGHTNRIRCRLDPWRPSLYALTPQRLPEKAVIESLTQP